MSVELFPIAVPCRHTKPCLCNVKAIEPNFECSCEPRNFLERAAWLRWMLGAADPAEHVAAMRGAVRRYFAGRR